MEEFKLIPSLIQASPSAAVGIVAIYFLFKLSKDNSEKLTETSNKFSDVIVKYSKEHTETQLKTVTKMQELTNIIEKLNEKILEQSSILEKMYKELWKKQKTIKSLRSGVK